MASQEPTPPHTPADPDQIDKPAADDTERVASPLHFAQDDEGADAEVARDDDGVPQFFDRAGMADIRRSLSRIAESAADAPRPDPHRTSSALSDSDITLADVHVGDGPFDFDKFLRGIVRKCVRLQIVFSLGLTD